MTRYSISKILAALLLLVAATGCVTERKMQTYVGEQIETVDNRVADVEDQVETNQTRITEQQQMLNEQQEMLESASDTARQALDRAVAAGQLAEGKLLYETVLSEDGVGFGFESAELGDEAKAALDTFAADLKSRNENVFIEIQGHTDGSGPETFNLKLGQERAEIVRHYLHAHHSLPLHRMSVISYGESSPVADESTREGRKKNRRVALVVLK